MIPSRLTPTPTRTAILAVLLTIAPVSTVIGQSLQDEREAFDYARVLFSDGLYDTAAEEYRRFILNYPTSERLAQARLKLADAYFHGGKLSEAVTAYQIFVDRHPDNIEVAAALRNRATALEQQNEHERAASAFTELYERFRTGEYAVQDLLSAGTNSRQAKDYLGAEQSFRTILTNHPSSPLIREATYNLGLVLTDQSRDSEALALFESVKESEREPDALLEIGRISLAQDHLPKTEQTFSSLRKQFPGTRSAQESYLVLGQWYERQAEWKKAIQTYDRAKGARLDTRYQQLAILGLARAYRKTGKDALQLYTQFLKVYPKSDFLPDARIGLGRSFVDQEKYRQAIDAFKRLQEEFPKHPFSVTAHRDIGDVYAALGSPRLALAAYQRHLDQDPPTDEASVTRLSMGRVYRTQLAWTDKALDILRDLTNSPDPEIAGSAQFQLGQTYELLGQTHLAVREYRNYLERHAGDPDAHKAERRIRYLLDFAPSAPLDHDLIELIGITSGDVATRYRLGRLLFDRRHYDEALPHLEIAAGDSAFADRDEAAYLQAEALLALDRQSNALAGSSPANQSRALSIYQSLVDKGSSNRSDDAALRAIELKHAGTDTASAGSRVSAYDQFVKTYPTSDRLVDSQLHKGDALLVLGRTSSQHIDRALKSYRAAAKSSNTALVEKAQYGVGRCLAIKKQYAQAENALRDFLFQYPDSKLGEEARFQLGLILLERGYLQSAAIEFADLLRSPTSVDLEKSSRALLAECYFRLKDYASAARTDESLLNRGADPAVLRRLGESYAQLGEDEKAISVLGLFARRFPSAAGADTLSFRRAELLAQLGRTGQAIDVFDRVAANYPKSPLKPQALSSVGRLHFEQGNYTAALTAVSGPASQKSEGIDELRILALLRLDRAKQARKEINSFRKAYPAAIDAVARFEVEEARVQLRYRNPKGARKKLEGVVKNHSGTAAAVDAEFFLIEALERVGKPDEHFAALNAFVKNRKENVNWARANLDLAEIKVKDDDYVGASKAYLNALSGNLEETERPVVMKMLYEAHRNLRLYDSAITYARNLIEAYPHHPLAQGARINIGEIYSEKGDHRKAIEEIRPHLTKLQNDEWSSAQFVIAKSHHDLGEYENALREYLKMIYNPQGSVNWLANAFMGRAQCFRALGRAREAYAELDKISARFSGTAFVLQAEQMRAEMDKELRRQ